MARGIGDDEFAARSAEVAVGDINGNSLFALRTKAIREQGKIDGLAGPVDAALLYRGELVFINRLAVVEKPANQRRLAVIDAAGGGKAQQFLAEFLVEKVLQTIVRLKCGGNGHQK